MLTSISPLGEGARHNRWSLTATSYVLGSVFAGVVVGLGLGALGLLIHDAAHPSPTVLGIAVASACALAAGLDLAGRAPNLTAGRQVNEDWLHRYRGWVYGAGFGLQLGVGVVTIVTTAAVYLVLALEVLIGQPLLAAVIGAVFGLVRAAPILSLARVRSGAELRDAHRRLVSWAGPAKAATVTVVLLAAVGSIAAVAGS